MHQVCPVTPTPSFGRLGEDLNLVRRQRGSFLPRTRGPPSRLILVKTVFFPHCAPGSEGFPSPHSLGSEDNHHHVGAIGGLFGIKCLDRVSCASKSY